MVERERYFGSGGATFMATLMDGLRGIRDGTARCGSTGYSLGLCFGGG
jgi:hypothetical protein